MTMNPTLEGLAGKDALRGDGANPKNNCSSVVPQPKRAVFFCDGGTDALKGDEGPPCIPGVRSLGENTGADLMRDTHSAVAEVLEKDSFTLAEATELLGDRINLAEIARASAEGHRRMGLPEALQKKSILENPQDYEAYLLQDTRISRSELAKAQRWLKQGRTVEGIIDPGHLDLWELSQMLARNYGLPIDCLKLEKVTHIDVNSLLGRYFGQEMPADLLMKTAYELYQRDRRKFPPQKPQAQPVLNFVSPLDKTQLTGDLVKEQMRFSNPVSAMLYLAMKCDNGAVELNKGAKANWSKRTMEDRSIFLNYLLRSSTLTIARFREAFPHIVNSAAMSEFLPGQLLACPDWVFEGGGYFAICCRHGIIEIRAMTTNKLPTPYNDDIDD